jgi:hypothetical protein
MIKINLFTTAAAILLALFSSCATPSLEKESKEKSKSENDLEEITPLIETDVWLYDSTKPNKSNRPHLPMEAFPKRYLSYPAFTSLIKEMKQTLNDQNALIYFDPKSDSTASLKERNNLIIKHDSTIFWKRINILKFYESWYYNKHTGEIVKKQLGYAVVQFDYDKEAPREWYYFFTSKEARAIYLKNW